MSKINKLGLGILVFDDICHLRNICVEIRDLCDEIVLCLQAESYHGEPINPKVVDVCNRLKKEGVVDDIVFFEAVDKHEDGGPDGPRLIETDKRNFLIQYLADKGCSHAQIIDSDEFYDHDDYARAKQHVDENEAIKVSYCEYVNYYRDYTHVMVWPFRCYVPFIAEVGYRFNFRQGSFDKPSDPTRRYHIPEEGGQFCIFDFRTIKMHHLSWIRTNIEDKINAWSSKLHFLDYEELKRRCIDRYENYKNGQNAIIMFNVPYYNVAVNKLSYQYINPKYPMEVI